MKDPVYNEVKQELIWSMDSFNDYLNEHILPKSHIGFERDWVYKTFTVSIILVYSVLDLLTLLTFVDDIYISILIVSLLPSAWRKSS